MNIVKYKDIYLKDIADLSQEDMDWFNQNLKGKYAYAVNWRWVFTLESLKMSDYISRSKANNPENPEGEDDIDWYDISKFEDFQDEEFTIKANSVEKYLALNKFSSDSEITLEDAKKFRTWLASTLLEIKDRESMEKGEDTMLGYYAGGMYDSTIDNLSIFSNSEVQYGVLGTSTCGCTKTGSIGSLTVGSVCDPVAIYRKGIYDLMVKLWSDNRYWTDLESDDFLLEFKRYIDAIVSYNLPLYTSDWTTVFSDCTCLNDSEALQSAGIGAMRNLSKALQYMIDGDVKGHKNFIDSSFRVFASQYYERMYWL